MVIRTAPAGETSDISTFQDLIFRFPRHGNLIRAGRGNRIFCILFDFSNSNKVEIRAAQIDDSAEILTFLPERLLFLTFSSII